jgi:hypothetical protein
MVSCGMLAAASFTTTMFTANSVATNISSAQQKFIYVVGWSNSIYFSIATQITTFNFAIFTKWGIILALFGTIILLC